MGHFAEMDRELLVKGLEFFRSYLRQEPDNEDAKRWVDHITFYLYGYVR